MVWVLLFSPKLGVAATTCIAIHRRWSYTRFRGWILHNLQKWTETEKKGWERKWWIVDGLLFTRAWSLRWLGRRRRANRVRLVVIQWLFRVVWRLYGFSEMKFRWVSWIVVRWKRWSVVGAGVVWRREAERRRRGGLLENLVTEKERRKIGGWFWLFEE